MQKIKKILSDKDERNLLKNIFMAFLVKGASLFVSVFSMPLYIKYFDDNVVLGLWFTILSMLSWISVCDLGLGNGLRNMLTKSLALNDERMGKKYVSSTYAAVTAIILPIFIVGSVVLILFDLNSFFNISEAIISAKTLKLSMFILFFGVCISFILKLIHNVVYAIQKSYLNNVMALMVSVIPLIYVFLFKGENVEKNLIALSLVHILAINIPSVFATFILFNKEYLKPYKFSLKEIDFNIGKNVLQFGTQFFLAQVFFMILMSTNEVLISTYFSPEYVVEYSAYYRLFTVIGSLFTLALSPLWSKITKDLYEKKYKKIKYTNYVLYICAGIAIIVQFAIVPILQFLFNIWLGDAAIKVDYTIAIIFASFAGLYVLNIALTTVANGIGNLKSQIVFYGIGALLKIPFAYFLKFNSLGWWYIIAYNACVIALFCMYQTFWVEKKIKSLIKSEE